ncbi:MAG: recombination mediator RecR [Candidatus Saccharibacteria bacterium]|nr:recombination mediator RecR [Candidatus Saccharibacteria bacterium]
MLPSALNDLIECLGRLPGVGPRTAERYAYFLLKNDRVISKNLANALDKLHDSVKTCPKTFALISEENVLSPLYDSPDRDKTTILVVEEPLDIYAIEHTKSYHGTYHVLGGAISPMDGVTADQLHIKELIDRVEEDSVKEIIIATNPSVEGESTAVLLEKLLHEKYPELQITRLARGLPLGISLEYADQITLASALNNRTKI